MDDTRILATALTALAVSAALALGACGDDEEETTGGETGGEATALTKAAYIEQASEICASTNRDLEQVVQGPLEHLSRIEQGLVNLRELPAPEGEDAQVDDMLSALERAIEVERQARAGKRPGTVGGDPYAEFARLAQQFGIEGGCTEAGR